MAFPKVSLIEGLTTDPRFNPAGSANFLSKEVLDEALILVRSFEPAEIARLSKTDTSQIAYAMSNYKEDNNRRYKTWNEESASVRRPGGEIRHLDNRIGGVRVQQASSIATGAISSSTGATGVVLWSAYQGLGSIIGRGSLPVLAALFSAAGAYFVNKKPLPLIRWLPISKHSRISLILHMKPLKTSKQKRSVNALILNPTIKCVRPHL